MPLQSSAESCGGRFPLEPTIAVERAICDTLPVDEYDARQIGTLADTGPVTRVRGTAATLTCAVPPAGMLGTTTAVCVRLVFGSLYVGGDGSSCAARSWASEDVSRTFAGVLARVISSSAAASS